MGLARRRRIRLLASVCLITVGAFGLTGCSSAKDRTAAVDPAAIANDGSPQARAALEQSTSSWERRYRRNPSNREVAVRYSESLRALGRSQQAVEVSRKAAADNPQDRLVLGEYGKALAASGKPQEALGVLTQALDPNAPDWRLQSALGTVLDQMQRGREAQAYYRAALATSPDNPSVLSNYGLSVALGGDLVQAEQLLRRGAEQPGAGVEVYQNLALVLGLQGRFKEAEELSARHLPPQIAASNSAYLRQMMSQQSGWEQLRQADARPKATN